MSTNSIDVSFQWLGFNHMLLLNPHHRRTSGQESLHLSQIFTPMGWMYLVLKPMAGMCGDFEFTPKWKRRGGERGRQRSRKGGREAMEKQKAVL